MSISFSNIWLNVTSDSIPHQLNYINKCWLIWHTVIKCQSCHVIPKNNIHKHCNDLLPFIRETFPVLVHNSFSLFCQVKFAHSEKRSTTDVHIIFSFVVNLCCLPAARWLVNCFYCARRAPTVKTWRRDCRPAAAERRREEEKQTTHELRFDSRLYSWGGTGD